MKSRILAAALAFLCSVTALAQEADDAVYYVSHTPISTKWVRWMPTAGYGFFNVSGESNLDGLSDKGGLAAGLLFDVGQGWFTGQSGVMYLEAGYGFRDEDTQETKTVNLKYVAVPVLAKASVVGNADRDIHVRAGVMPAFLTSSDMSPAPKSGLGAMAVDNDILTQEDKDKRTAPIENLAKNDVLMVAGIGGNIKVHDFSSGFAALAVDLTFFRGLMDIYETDDRELYNQGLSLTLGLLF